MFELLDNGERLQIITAPVFKPLLRPSRYKGVHGGRGSGKSHFFAELLVETALVCPRLTGVGLRWVCAREIQKSLEQSAKRLVEDKIRASGMVDLFDIQRDRIITPGNGIITFMGLQDHTAESARSLEGYDGLWAEESHTLTEKSIDLIRPTFRKDPTACMPVGSELWFSWNPHFETDPIDRLLRGDSRPSDADAIVVESNWSDNPWFPNVLRQEKDYDLRRDPLKYAHIWLGKYKKESEALIFKNWKVEYFDTPPDARFYYGADFGYAVDPAVLVRMFIGRWKDGIAIPDPQGRNLFIDHEAYQVGCEIDNLPALFAGTDLRRPARWDNPSALPGVPDALTWTIRADSSRPDTISYLQRRGFKMVPSIKGKDSVKDGIEFIRSFDVIIHERCRHTRDEFASYAWKVDDKTSPPTILPEPADKVNHVIDSARYALEQVRRKGVSMVDYL